MKIVCIILASLVIFSGCSITDLDYRMRNKKARAALYKQQQAQKRASLKAKKEAIRKRKRIKARQSIPKPPKKHITLKKVEDDNYSAEYMYPKAKKTTSPKVSETTPLPVLSSSMTKEECIEIIGQAKFDLFTQKFGNEASTLKRCKMMKAMK